MVFYYQAFTKNNVNTETSDFYAEPSFEEFGIVRNIARSTAHTVLQIYGKYRSLIKHDIKKNFCP
jgi:hypothetical protein